jgi:hypothetical protein
MQTICTSLLCRAMARIWIPNSISSSPLVKKLLESSNIRKIQEYEEKDMAGQLQNQDLDF